MQNWVKNGILPFSQLDHQILEILFLMLNSQEILTRPIWFYILFPLSQSWFMKQVMNSTFDSSWCHLRDCSRAAQHCFRCVRLPKLQNHSNAIFRPDKFPICHKE